MSQCDQLNNLLPGFVGVSARLVSAGVLPGENNQPARLRLALVAMPNPAAHCTSTDGNAQDHALQLKHWPSQMATQFMPGGQERTVPVWFAPASRLSADCAHGFGEPVELQAKLACLRPDDPTMKRIDVLWHNVISSVDERADPWSLLSQVLQQQRDSKSLTPANTLGELDGSGQSDADADENKADDTSGAQEIQRTVQTVIPTMRAAAARVYAKERADALWRSVRQVLAVGNLQHSFDTGILDGSQSRSRIRTQGTSSATVYARQDGEDGRRDADPMDGTVYQNTLTLNELNKPATHARKRFARRMAHLTAMTSRDCAASLDKVDHTLEKEDPEDNDPDTVRLAHIASLQRDESKPIYVSDKRAVISDDEPASSSENEHEAAHVRMQRVFGALQSIGALARVFQFTIDLEIDLTRSVLEQVASYTRADSRAHLKSLQELEQEVSEKFAFLKIATPFGRPARDEKPHDDPLVWTLAKLRLPGVKDELTGCNSDDPGSFWPAQREELIASIVKGGDSSVYKEMLKDVNQIDGVSVLGRLSGPGEDPRFELTSLDTFTATQTDIEQREAALQLPGDSSTSSCVGEACAFTPDIRTTAQVANKVMADTMLADPRPLRTAGLCLLDKRRQDRVVDAIATTQFQRVEIQKARQALSAVELMLDADELTVGFRLDAGYRESSSGWAWTSLTNRRVTFRDPGSKSSWLERAIAQLLPHKFAGRGASRVADRAHLDAALLATASRLMRTDAKGESIRVFTEELIVQWEGDPLGVSPSDGGKVSGDGTSDPAIDRSYDLFDQRSDDADGLRPPALRFGRAYRFGIRPVYLGQVCRDIESAAKLYDQGCGGQLTAPAGARLRRFRRYEKVEAPVLGLPRSHLPESPAVAWTEPPFPFEQATHAIVRSSIGSDASAGFNRPARTERMLLPPRRERAFVTWHGRFDNVDAAHPSGAYPNIELSDTNDSLSVSEPIQRIVGGSPVTTHFRFVADPKPLPGNETPDPTNRCPTQVISVASRSRTRWSDRKKHYYPDPAADFMVLALSHADSAGTPSQYLPGKPLVVDLYPGDTEEQRKLAYPDALPVLLDIRSVAGDLRHGLEHHDVFRNKIGVSSWSDNSGPSVPVRRVQIDLACGEDLVLETWCIPTVKKLQYWFAQIEDLSVLIPQFGDANGSMLDDLCTPMMSNNSSNYDIISTVLALLPRGPLPSYSSGKFNVCAGTGNAKLPTDDLIERLARICHIALRHRPIPELVSTRTIRLTHAVVRPLLKPSFGKRDAIPAAKMPRRSPIELELRTAALDVAKAKLPVGSNSNEGKLDRIVNVPEAEREMAYEQYFQSDAVRPDETEDQEIVIGGTAYFDAQLTHTLELRARCISPHSDKFDVPVRGRSRLDKTLQNWPRTPGRAGPDAGLLERTSVSDTEPVSGQTGFEHSYKPASDLFGFLLDDKGYTVFPDQEVTLLRIKNIARQPPVGDEDESVPSEHRLTPIDLHALYLLSGQDTNTGDARPVTLPRVLEGAFIERPYRLTDGLARRLQIYLVAVGSHSVLFRTRRRLNPGSIPQNLLVKAQNPTAEQQSVKSDTITVWAEARRRPKSLVPKLARPAFEWNSEPASKFGDVVSIDRQAVVRVRFRRPMFSSGEGEKIGLILPPSEVLGSDRRAAADLWRNYVTRVGADPGRTLDIEGPEFPPIDVFRDASLGDALVEDRIARSVPVPVPGTESVLSPVAFDADLVLYEPRFDPAREEWYADINLSPGNLPDPFVRLGLVRYQPHAPIDIRSSDPVVTWCQLPSKRSAYAQPRIQDGMLSVEVRVSGNRGVFGSLKNTRDHERETRYREPLMIMSLIRRMRGASDRIEEQIIATCEVKPSNTDIIPHSVTDAADVVWTSVGLEDRDFTCFNGSAEYRVFVEEIEYRRPASYPVEPVVNARSQSDSIDLFTPSNPRFSVLINLGPESSETGRSNTVTPVPYKNAG